MALLDVDALVALAWDSHVHHVAIRSCFAAHAASGWATSPTTESGLVRVSSNPKVLPNAIPTPTARQVLAALRRAPGHRFLGDDVSMVDSDVPPVSGHRQVTDAHLVTLARRHGVGVVTFDAGLAALAGHRDVELLTAL
ncbi:TA system VapC family ribonuclease toxin [Geodermatophilus sp. URMC 61]|uniref:TA system VapC family ribonuclease toxin n=1 Tax=Geodermatophilus sp. URMC 61 TaxID=3423411 RepID=UPI00406CAC73